MSLGSDPYWIFNKIFIVVLAITALLVWAWVGMQFFEHFTSRCE